MTSDDERPPVLVLGLGNLLLCDDAIGLRMLHVLRELHGCDPRVEFVDGGTQGLALLGVLADRAAVLMLDAIQLGAAPGTVHRIEDAGHKPPRTSLGAPAGAHQQNAGDLLLAASLLGELPPRAVVVGVEPATVRTGIRLSAAVQAALPDATAVARRALLQLLALEVTTCTN